MGDVKYPIHILSDLHLGHPASDLKEVSQLRPLLEGAGTLIFNGDTWQQLALDLREESGRLFQELKALCEELEAEAIFLPGNHDPSISETLYLNLEGGKVAVLHGDVIFPEVSPWSKYYLAEEEKIQAYLKKELTPEATLEERYKIAHEVVHLMKPARRPISGQSKWAYYASMLYPPRRLWTLGNVKRLAKKQSREFCKQYFPDAQFIIYGHFHLPLIDDAGAQKIINTGAYMEGCQSLLVKLKPEEILLYDVKKEQNGLCLPTLKESFKIS